MLFFEAGRALINLRSINNITIHVLSAARAECLTLARLTCPVEKFARLLLPAKRVARRSEYTKPILQKMREVAVQAANDTNNDQDRADLQAEMDAISTEIDRIAGTTTWAGANLMEASVGTSFSLQVGTATGDKNQIDITIIAVSAKALGIRNACKSGPGVTTPLSVGAEFLINATTTRGQTSPSVTALAN